MYINCRDTVPVSLCTNTNHRTEDTMFTDTRNTTTTIRPPGNTQQIATQPPPTSQSAAVCAIPGKQNQYFVESEDKKTAYRVFWDGTNGQCTCADFARRNSGYHKGELLCAHIHTVKNCTQQVTCGKPVNEIEATLSRRFTDNQLVDGQYGDKSVKFEEVVKRLNEAFGALYWSFSHEEPIDCGDSFTCAGRLEIEFGGVKAWKENTGHCQYVDGGQADGMAGARTGSAQNALVNCALLFGVGLEQSSKPPVNTERRLVGGLTQPFRQERPF